MSKIKRKYLAHYIDTAAKGGTEAYERLGKDLEEFNVEMNANVEKKNNIIGETTISIDSYQKQASVTPYYAEEDSPLGKRLQDIIDNELTGDDLLTHIIDVHMWEPTAKDAKTFKAIKNECFIEVQSYGGNTSGYQIPFNVHYTSVHEEGTFDTTTKTFTKK